VDGNRDRFGVSFTHAAHATRADTLYNGCATCHHLNLPGDQNTECASCHSDMFSSTDAFGHDWHASPSGAELSCGECHPIGEVRQAETATDCATCHTDLIPHIDSGHTLLFNYPVESYVAPSYADAMHGVCLECHSMIAEEKNDVGYQQCSFCHSEHPSFANIGSEEYPTSGKVIVPVDRGDESK